MTEKAKVGELEICQRLAAAVQAIGEMPEGWEPPLALAGAHPDRPGELPKPITNTHTHGQPWREAERAFYSSGNAEALLDTLSRHHAGQPETPDEMAAQIIATGEVRAKVYRLWDAWDTNRELWRRAWWAALCYQHVNRVWSGVLGPGAGRPLPREDSEPSAGQEAE